MRRHFWQNRKRSENMKNVYDIDYSKGLVELGDDRYICSILKKAHDGHPITVGFLGGSITQDAVTTEHKFCYAYRVYEWFVNNFKTSEISYVNAGIGATDSEFAAARLEQDLLCYKPDFILMEHAVNDLSNEHYKETYEGVVRHILNANPLQALLLMCNVYYNNGESAEIMHRRVARHYNLPVVSMRTTIYEALLRGSFDNRLITQDDLHPNDDGHALVAKVITTYLDGLLEKCEASDWNVSDVEKRAIPSALTDNRYENSCKYDNRNTKSVEEGSVLIGMSGFEVDQREQSGPRDCFKNGYSTNTLNAYAEYEVYGSCIAVQYKRTINLPAPIAKVTVDGNDDTATILDANFDETWGDKLVLEDIYMSNTPSKHIVRVEIIETHKDDVGDFYLAGIIVSK